MNLSRCYRSVLAVALALTVAERGAGPSASEPRRSLDRADDVQPTISPGPIASRVDSGEIALLAQKIIGNLSDKQKAEWARQMKADPRLQERVTEVLNKNPELHDLVRSADPKKLQELTDVLLQKTGRTPEKPTEVTPKPTEPMVTPERPPMPDPRVPPPAESPFRADEPKADEPSAFRKYLAKTMPKAADLLADLGLTADADFLRALFNGKMPSDNDGYLSRIVSRASGVAKDLPLQKLFSGDISGAFENVHLPSMPKFNLPFGSSSSGGAGGASPTVVSSEGAGSGLVWVLILLVFLACLWKGKDLIRSSTGKTPRPWSLGPWPVRPERVRTRADLIKAFEYLAFLVLGLAARPRNHRDLASDLAASGDKPSRRSAADRLASCYERARYAPQEEALPDDELRAARIDLTYLAGVGRA